MINCRTHQFSDTNIGRTEIATIVDLARGCSPTHIMLANRMGAWSDVAFSWYSARNTSVRKLQLSDKAINFRTALIIGVQKQSQISKVACKVAYLFSNTPPNLDRKRPRLCSALLVFARFLNQMSDKNHRQNVSQCSSIPAWNFMHAGTIRYRSRMTHPALECPQDQSSPCMHTYLVIRSCW